MEAELLFEKINDIGVATFNRPGSRNAITFEMYEALVELCESINDQSLAIRSLVITGAGGEAFAAGTEISNFSNLISAKDALAYEQLMDRVFGSLESLNIPTVAAIQGACTGGGAIIAACCDIRIASDDIRFGVPVARTLGNCLSIDNLSRLIVLLGEARTREILLTSRLIQVEEALAINLINESVSNPIKRAIELCEQMNMNAPLTIKATKEGLRRISALTKSINGDDLIVECYTSSDFKEGMDAFLAKRKPVWQGF